MNATDARDFLERHGLAPSKDRGQNFLHDDALAEKLVRVAGVGPNDSVLEIGTGLGILTRALAGAAARVRSVEIDGGLIRGLRGDSILPAEVELVHADALDLDLAAQIAELGEGGAPVRVVANLPYSVATPLLRRLLDVASNLAGIGVMVQREVAARMRAVPSNKDYGSLSVIHQWVVDVGDSLDLHGRCFYPVPRVVSTFITLGPREKPLVEAADLVRMERIVRAGFAHRRKTLVNSLKRAANLDPAYVTAVLVAHEIDPRTRAENLSPEAWQKIGTQLADPIADQ